jgi:hypothetical protein
MGNVFPRPGDAFDRMTTMNPETLMEAVRYFADLEICDAYMRRIKWPRGRIVCPHCGCDRIGEIKGIELLNAPRTNCLFST